uniref:MPN domain-containing protein n=1 Tax=Trichuris muris TaxID=70415 RepID=A0A5S6R5K9_TRIMR
MERTNSPESSGTAQSVRDDMIYVPQKGYDENVRFKKPWTKNVQYFKHVKMSTLALMKIVNHAHSGKNLEVMGMLQGKVQDHTIIVMDVYALPVEGTETRVNAQAEAYEYMTEYVELCEDIGFVEHVVGWYHSHPGYGCWLSGIDVDTQVMNQNYLEPFVAIVVDPIRTTANGRVDIGAFRTYPKHYKPVQTTSQEYQSIPLEKIEDFGVHCDCYYRLDISYFSSSFSTRILEVLWNQNWPNTLSSSDGASRQEYVTSQMNDLAAKMRNLVGVNGEASKKALQRACGFDKDGGKKLKNLNKDLCAFAGETVNIILNEMVKKKLFASLGERKVETLKSIEHSMQN